MRSRLELRTRSVLIGAFLVAIPAAAATSKRAEGGESPRAEVVVAWNARANSVATRASPATPFAHPRACAMTMTAMHDALNAVVPEFTPFAYRGVDPKADPVAAASTAAHEVLLAIFPGAREELDAELERWLETVSPGDGRSRGIALGRNAAHALLTRRAHDGWDTAGRYEFRDDPGAYRTTPGWNGLVAQPGFRFATPFVLTSPSELRPPAQPSLTSAAYAAAFEEVKRVGSAASGARTADQTNYAIWWMEYAESSLNRLLRDLVTQRAVPLRPSARAFALLNIGLYDTYIAVWDSKFEYEHWRPWSAIREAGRDGNPATEPEPGWESLRPAPPFPEYVSAHAAACASAFEILARTFGDATPFSLATTTAPPAMPSRTFLRFSAAAEECADSRVRLGWHFRYATDAGLELGGAVARAVAERILLPVRPRS